MSTSASPPLSFYGPTPEGFPPLARLSVERYERMIDSGLFGDDDRFELIEGTLVQKMTKKRRHSSGSEKSWREIQALLPTGWHVEIEKPVRIPQRDSMPEPDVSVVRGEIDDYLELDPGPADLALVVEVSYSTVRADRALAATYLGGGIPVYWLLNVRDRQLEVFTREAGPHAPTILDESDTVDLVIAGVVVGQIAVAKLLPQQAK
ncbi:MAG: Uma2 family endonuclease [Isosphaeraceae bacterium]